jgi:DNA-binding SARP family transcriptional activator/predicted negative regulator of RcsB-dependent stress response
MATLAGRSAAHLASLTALPPDRAAAAVVADGTTATALLLGRDWLSLAEHVRHDDGTYPAGFAWRCGYALKHLGHHTDAEAIVTYADTSGATDSDRARLAAVAASVAWSRGEEERCRELTEEATKHARVADDPGAEASACVVNAFLAASTGDRDANLAFYERALVLAEQAGDLLTLERVRNNLGSRSLEEGRNDEALQHLQLGLEVNARTGHLSGLAVLRHNRSEALLGLGRIDEALVECDAARDLWTQLEAPSACASWQLRGDVQTARGNATQAVLAYRQAAELAAAEDDMQTRAAALVSEAAALASQDPTRATALVEEALGIPSPVGHAIPVVTAGWVRLAVGDAEAARHQAALGLDLATRHRDLPRLADALELAALADPEAADADARLREAAGLWREVANPLRLLTNELVTAQRARDRLTEGLVREELHSLGVHDDVWRIAGPLHAARHRPDEPEVHVHVLGAFGVEVGGEPVPASAWPSRKAREVLTVLAVRGARGVSRERLGALVWPDAEGVGNRLSVALSHVRAVLDPGRAFTADHHVVADRDTVRLDLRHVDVDLVGFVAAARAALAAARAGSPRAVRMLEAAAAMHTGELGEGWLEGEVGWADGEREESEALGRDVLRTLAAAVAAGERPADALTWYSRLVAADPYDEAAYAELVGLLCRLGRYGEARHHHRAYELRMAELDVPAQPWAEMARA